MKKMKANSVGGRYRPNKYRDLKPSQQRNTAGQRRVARRQERRP